VSTDQSQQPAKESPTSGNRFLQQEVLRLAFGTVALRLFSFSSRKHAYGEAISVDRAAWRASPRRKSSIGSLPNGNCADVQ
jgi:hypothetical protein